MTIIKIAPDENGGHQNQTIQDAEPKTFPIPDGYALLPEELGSPQSLENFPFGSITAETRDGVPTITSWKPLPVPELPDPGEQSYTADEVLSALLG